MRRVGAFLLFAVATALGSAVGTVASMRLVDERAASDFALDMSLPPCSRTQNPYLCASDLPQWQRHAGPAFPRCVRALGTDNEVSWRFCEMALPMWPVPGPVLR